MAEKKNATSKKTTAKKTTKAAPKKVTTKKTENKAASKSTKQKTIKETKVKKETIKVEEKKLEKPVKVKKECKLVKWFKDLSLKQLIVMCTIAILVLLLVLIGVATKNTKTTNGKDIVVSIKGKTITADDLYASLKEDGGLNTVINIIDEYLIEKEYKTTKDMKESADANVESYKTSYGESYASFLEYNGLKDDNDLKEILIKNSKITLLVEDFIKADLTEKEMKKYYEEKIYGDISAKHILITADYEDGANEETIKAAKEKAKQTAQGLIDRIKNGEDFSALAKEFSNDEGTKENGGDLGYFNTGDMVEAFEKAAYALEVNAYTTEPVETTYGYHIIMKTGEKEKPAYKKAKDTVIEKMIADKKEEDSTITNKALIALREKYNIKIKDKAIKKAYNDYKKEATTETKDAE